MQAKIEVIPAKPWLTNRVAPNHQKKKKIRVAVYCRVSTDQFDQLESLENQQAHYYDYVLSHPEYELVKIYADEGITGTNIRKREQFKEMIEACRAGHIDMVITKAISRFARNTADCLKYTRMLRDMGIGVFFEKENIFTLDGKGELLITIMSSLAQEESRNISENTMWGIRARFQRGEILMNTSRFLGYDKDKTGKLVINKEQATIVRRVYNEFLEGYSPDVIAARLNKEKVPGVHGKPLWKNTTVYVMLQNEKYKGDALLQKYITTDYLQGTTIRNDGRVAQYYVKGSHEAIIPPEQWEIVQLELKRRREFKEKHKLRTLGRYTDEQPFSSRIFCGACGGLYMRRTMYRLAGDVKEWQCENKYIEEASRCKRSRTVTEEDLHVAFMIAWNRIIATREERMRKWMQQKETGSPLEAFYADRFMRLSEDTKPMEKLDLSFVTKTLDHVVVEKDGSFVFHLLDGSVEAADPG